MDIPGIGVLITRARIGMAHMSHLTSLLVTMNKARIGVLLMMGDSLAMKADPNLIPKLWLMPHQPQPTPHLLLSH